MTPWHYRWLCRFAYIDLPDPVSPGRPLREITRLLLSLNDSSSLPCGPLSDSDREALRILADTPVLADLILEEYINRNSSTGLVCCVLRDASGCRHIIFRGSESRVCGAPSGVDWLDNLLAPFTGSIQYPEIAALAQRYPDARVVFSGHSKGAHNALYALASLPGEYARAVVFNGQGFARSQLTRVQQTRLSRQAVNYVARTDPVGALLFHPEKRIFVRVRPGVHPHDLAALSFDSGGRLRPAMRPLWSYALEFSSRAAVRPKRLPCARGAVCAAD